MSSSNHKIKILLWDCETAPLISANWGIWEQNAVWIIKDFYMLCYSYKWLDEKQTHVVGLDDFKGYKPGSEDDYDLICELHELFEEADVVIAHNGDSFDQKIANARFMVNKLGPPTPYQQIDTKKVAKKYARFTSNKLDDLGSTLNLGQKLSTGGAKLWRDCMAGDRKAWKKMKSYNKQDVVLLEQLYMELRPWIQNHPALNVYEGKPNACRNCGSEDIKTGMKYRASNTKLYQYFKCMGCGANLKARISEKTENPTYA